MRRLMMLSLLASCATAPTIHTNGAHPREVDLAARRAARVWDYESGHPPAATLFSTVHVTVEKYDVGYPTICHSFESGACATRFAPGHYVIQYPAGIPWEPMVLCHEMLHVLLWEAGVDTEDHHTWMHDRNVYTCYL